MTEREFLDLIRRAAEDDMGVDEAVAALMNNPWHVEIMARICASHWDTIWREWRAAKG